MTEHNRDSSQKTVFFPTLEKITLNVTAGKEGFQ